MALQTPQSSFMNTPMTRTPLNTPYTAARPRAVQPKKTPRVSFYSDEEIDLLRESGQVTDAELLRLQSEERATRRDESFLSPSAAFLNAVKAKQKHNVKAMSILLDIQANKAKYKEYQNAYLASAGRDATRKEFLPEQARKTLLGSPEANTVLG